MKYIELKEIIMTDIINIQTRNHIYTFLNKDETFEKFGNYLVDRITVKNNVFRYGTSKKVNKEGNTRPNKKGVLNQSVNMCLKQ